MGVAEPMTEQIEPDTGLTESTRQMFTEKYAEAFNKLVDEILKPVPAPIVKPVDHSILLDELNLMREAHLTIGGEQNRFNASVLQAAIAIIIGI